MCGVMVHASGCMFREYLHSGDYHHRTVNIITNAVPTVLLYCTVPAVSTCDIENAQCCGAYCWLQTLRL